MQLVVLGLNHKTAPVEVRECFAFSKETCLEGLTHLESYAEILEAAVLTTCNRSEIYAVIDETEGGYQQALGVLFDFFAALAGLDRSTLEHSYFYSYRAADCIRHLFRVAASLDSLVIGEGQILSQVKQAYALACKAGSASTLLNQLFQHAIAAGKRVRTETKIAFNSVSVSYAAVQLAEKLYGSLADVSVLIYGAGKMAELTALNFRGRKVKKLFVANRHEERAKRLAALTGSRAVSLQQAMEAAEEADVIVTSTGAPHYVVKNWETRQLMSRRRGRKLLVIDIAVPRDVEPTVGEIEGVKLYNIDDLEAVVEEHRAERQEEARQAARIVAEETKVLEEKFQYLSCRPLMAYLSERAESIRQRELKHAFSKLGLCSKKEKRILEQMTQRIVRKLLREPMTKLNKYAGTEREAFYAEAMRQLFQIDLMGAETKSEQFYNPYRYPRQ